MSLQIFGNVGKSETTTKPIWQDLWTSQQHPTETLKMA